MPINLKLTIPTAATIFSYSLTVPSAKKRSLENQFHHPAHSRLTSFFSCTAQWPEYSPVNLGYHLAILLFLIYLGILWAWVLMQSDSPGANDSSNSHSACRLCSSLLLVLTEPCGTLNQMGRQRVFLSQWGSTRMKSGQPWLPLAVPWSLCLLLRNWTLAPLEVILHETNVPIQ